MKQFVEHRFEHCHYVENSKFHVSFLSLWPDEEWMKKNIHD